MRCYILDRSASADSAALSFTPNSVYFEKTCVPGNSIVILSHVGDELLVPNFFLFGRCQLRKSVDVCPSSRLRTGRFRQSCITQYRFERGMPSGLLTYAQFSVPIGRIRTPRETLPDQFGQQADANAQLPGNCTRHCLHGESMRWRFKNIMKIEYIQYILKIHYSRSTALRVRGSVRADVTLVRSCDRYRNSANTDNRIGGMPTDV